MHLCICTYIYIYIYVYAHTCIYERGTLFVLILPAIPPKCKNMHFLALLLKSTNIEGIAGKMNSYSSNYLQFP